MFAEFHFVRPEWFFAIIPALLVTLPVIKKSRSLSGWEKICDPALLKYQMVETDHRTAGHPAWLRSLIPLFLSVTIIALAGPTWSKKEQPVFQQSNPLVIILDLSYSMNASDIKPTRLERARLKIRDILQSRSEGQSALIAFAGDTHIVSPLTNDNKTIMSLLPALSSSIMPVPGSQISDALLAAEQLLKNAGMPTGKIIVLTDGVDDPQAYIRATQLKQQGYQVSVIGVGTLAGSPVPSPQGSGFIKDVQGQAVLSKLEPEKLEELARSGGGEFHTLSLDNRDFSHILSADSLEDDLTMLEQDDQIEQWVDQGAILSLFIIPFALLAFRKGLLAVLAAMLLFPALHSDPVLAASTANEPLMQASGNNKAAATHNFWGYLWKTPDQKGQDAFDQKDYASAAKHFENPLWKAGANYRAGNFDQAIEEYSQSDDADSWYNKGNALARLGQFPQAIAAYDQALKQNPELKDAQNNRDYIKDLLSKQQQKQQNQDQDSDSKEQKDSESSTRDSQKSEQQKSDSQEQQKQDDQSKDSEQQDSGSQSEQNKMGEEQQQDQNQTGTGAEDQEDQEAQSQSGTEQEEQNQSGQDSDQQKEQQGQQAEQDNESGKAQGSEQQNEQNRQQDQPAANGSDQPMKKPPPEKDMEEQAQRQANGAETDDTGIPEDEANRTEAAPRDVMSQLSKEQQQSLNQWLQRIPDDPSELLRRKFYMNSQLRQRRQMTPAQNRGNPW